MEEEVVEKPLFGGVTMELELEVEAVEQTLFESSTVEVDMKCLVCCFQLRLFHLVDKFNICTFL